MSTIVVLKHDSGLVLGTDSRYMSEDGTDVATDSAPKIFEIAPEMFIAPSGWKIVCDFQVEKAQELVRTLGTTDIRIIAQAMVQPSIFNLEELAEILRSLEHPHEKIQRALAGELTLHVSCLVGRNSSGELGYVTQAYRIQAGRVTCLADEYFGAVGRIWTSSGDPAMQIVQEDSTILAGGPVEVVQKLLAALGRRWPTIGGEDQIVCIDGGGAHWISRPPAIVAGHGLETSDALFAGQVTFAYSGGGKITINSSGLTMADNNISPTATVTITSGGISLVKGAASCVVTSGGVQLLDGTGASCTIASGSIVLLKGTSSVTISSGGVTIVGGILNSPVITGGSIAVVSGTTTINIDSANKIKITDSAGFVNRLDNFGLSVSATGSPNCTVSTSGFSVITGSGISSLNDGALFMRNIQVLSTRQGGPGNPSFASFSDVQTWCQNLYNALKPGGHGLVT